MGSIEVPYKVLDQYHSEPRHLRIIHVGAGAAGLLAAYKAEQWLSNYELVCYEKNPVIGGTWYENEYPGCACDIPAHTYTFSFEPKTDWSGYYSFSDEIQDYMVKFYHKYKLEKYVKLNTTVTAARWLESEGKWEVQLEENGRKFTDKCHILVNGTGVVNQWKWPVIEGIESYKGILSHSANWDTTLDWAGKNVGIIGSGSSSIQMVPYLAETAKTLTVFARNTTWISPQMALVETAVDPNGEAPAAAGKHHYTAAEKDRFKKNPAYHLEYRKMLESQVAEGFPMFLRGSEENVAAKRLMAAEIMRRIGPGHEDLKKKFIPSWSPGCRRLTPGEGYLEALTKDHVKTVQEEISKFTGKGILTEDGIEHEFDIIACATGFDIQYMPHFPITGVDGAVMQEEWKSTPNIYLSITAPKFPNYFVINGPTGNWGQGCALPSHEVQVEYVMQCAKKMQEDRILALEVRQAPTTQVNQHLDAWHKELSIWAEDCRSWYKDNKVNGRVYIWPGSLLHHLKTLKTPRFEHYDVRYMDDNIFSFLGNGRIDLELEKERGGAVDLVPYIRNEDAEWTLEMPKAKRSGDGLVEELPRKRAKRHARDLTKL